MQRTNFMLTLSLSAFGLLGQDSLRIPIDRYNTETGNCANNSCKDKAEEAAADVIETLIKRPTPSISGLLVKAPPMDTNEGRRLALKLMPDRMQGASAGVGGGTSLASLANVSELISGAMESGAFQKNTAGTVSTIRANAIGAYRLLSGDCPKGAIQAFPACVSEDHSAWRGLSVVFSFDSSRNDQTVPANAADPAKSVNALFVRARRGLAAAGIRYEFYRPANQKSKDFAKTWNDNLKNLSETGAAYGIAVEQGPAQVIVPGLADRLPAKLHALLILLPETERAAAAEKFVVDYLVMKKLSITKEKWDQYQGARKAHLKSEVQFFSDTLSRRLFTVEFTHQRPKDEPEYGNVNFIWAHTAGKHQETVTLGDPSDTVEVPNWDLTMNLGLNFFYDKNAAQKNRSLRDFHAAFQADRKLSQWKFLNTPTFTLAGYYQRLTDDSVLSFNSDSIAPGTGIVLPKPANVILKGTKGDVGLVQAKLTIPFKDSGVSFPIAITWSNRTELLNIPGNDVRGHFGFLFDMDKLLTSLQGKAK